MRVSGVQLDGRIRSTKLRLKGAHGAWDEAAVARHLAELLALRDFYRSSVHARFSLGDEPVQTTLSVALAFTRYAPRPKWRALRREIGDARRVKLEVLWPYFEGRVL